MKLVKKGEAPKDDDAAAVAEVPSYPWDHAIGMLSTGDYDVLGFPRGERGPDQPGAQSPAPGVDPLGRKEQATDGHVLTNLDGAAAPGTVSAGLPKAPAPAKANVVEAPKVVAPAAPAAPTPAPAAKP